MNGEHASSHHSASTTHLKYPSSESPPSFPRRHDRAWHRTVIRNASGTVTRARSLQGIRNFPHANHALDPTTRTIENQQKGEQMLHREARRRLVLPQERFTNADANLNSLESSNPLRPHLRRTSLSHLFAPSRSFCLPNLHLVVRSASFFFFFQDRPTDRPTDRPIAASPIINVVSTQSS